jgi:hypothetical protein
MGLGHLNELSREGRLVSGVMVIGCHEASIKQRRALLVVIEDKQPDSRREIALLAFRTDTADQISQRYATVCSYIPQSLPKRVFKADARLTAADDD